MTDEQLLSLLRVPDLTEKQSGLSRFVTGAISAPARAVGGIADAFNNWFGKGVSPEDNLALGSTPVSRAEVDELTANPTPESTGEWVGEIGNQLSPMTLQIMATGRAVAPVANVVRSPVAAAAIRNAAEFGVLGAQHSADIGTEQALEGGAYGVARALPNRYRWLATAPIAYASKVWFDQHDPNPIAPEVLGGTTQGDLNAILGFATSFGKQLPLRGVRNNFTNPIPSPSEQLRLGNREPQLLLEDRALEGQIVEPFDTANQLRAGAGEVQPNGDVWAGYYGTPQRLLTDKPSVELPMLPEGSGVRSVDEIRSSIPRPDETIIPPTFEGYWGKPVMAVTESPAKEWSGMSQDILNEVGFGPKVLKGAARADELARNVEASPMAQKGKLKDFPSWWAESGGGISDDMSQAMGKAALGATAGAGVGAPSGNAGTGAAIGVVAAFSPQLAKKLASGAKTAMEVLSELDTASAKLPAISNKRVPIYKAKEALAKEFPEVKEELISRDMPRLRKQLIPDNPQRGVLDDEAFARTYAESTYGGKYYQFGIAPLPSVIKSDSLYQDYPFLKDVTVKLKKGHLINNDAWATHLGTGDGNGVIIIDKDHFMSSNRNKVKYTLAHEILHAIQDKKVPNKDFNLEHGTEAGAARLIQKYLTDTPVATNAKEWMGWNGPKVKQGDTVRIRDKNTGNSAHPSEAVIESIDPQGTATVRITKDFQGSVNKIGDKISVHSAFLEKKGLKSLDKGEAGFALPAVNQAMARASLGAAGGAVLGSLSDEHGENSGLALGAITGALVATFGPEAAIGLKNFITKERLPVTKTSTTNVLKSWAQRREELAGRAFNNTDVMSRFVRWIDNTFEATMPPDVKQALIRSEGIANFHVSQIDAALEKLAKGYEPNAKLIEAADRYLVGDGLTADQFAQIAKTLDPNSGNYADFVISARENINALQRLVEAGANDKQKGILSNSIGKYLTRSYKLFTHKSWLPSEESINKLVDELKGTKSFKGASDEQIRFHLKHYVKEAKLKQTFYTGFSGEGERIAQASFQGRKSLSDAWLDFLGVIKDPKERVLHTALRLKPMAEAGNYFATIAKQEVEGMTQVFDDFAAVEAMRTNLKGKLSTATKEEAEQININLARLDSLQQLDKQPHFGSLGGKLVTRNVADSLAGIEQLTDPKNGFFRSMSKFNTLIKTGDTVLHPITMLRNYLTTLVMMGIARVNPANLKEAHQILMNSKHPLSKEIFEMGIANADQVSGELIRDFRQATGGTLDLSSTLSTMLGLNQAQADIITKSAMKPLQLMQSAYRYPDNLTRVAAYLSARARFADKLGLPETAQEVKDLASKFTHRYTMNYAAVIPAVKIARQMPFVSQFISYTAEAARITKNLFEDVLKGDNGYNHSRMMALIPIAALAFGPEIISGAGESNLSLSEKAEWEKMKSLMPDWERGTYKYVHGKKDGKFQYSTFSPLIPTDSINQLFASIAKGDFKAALENNPIFSRENTPMLNLASSIVYGEDYKTHKKYRGFGDFAAVAAREILPPLFPTGAEWEKMQQAYTRNTEGGEGLKIKGRNITPDMFWKPYWSGMRISESSLSDLQKMAVQRAKSAIAAESSYVNDILKSNAAPEVKAPIVERSKKAIQLIQASLRDQLQDVPR